MALQMTHNGPCVLVLVVVCVCVVVGGGGWFWVKESTYMTGDINSWAALALAPVRSGTQI